MIRVSRGHAQRGSAMLVTLILVAALLAGGVVLTSMQMNSNRATEVTNTGVSAMYCAEAGLAAARTAVVANYTSWAGNLNTGTEPPWLNAIDHDIDVPADNVSDFTITLKDDDDELTGTNDLSVDQNLRIFVVSTCTKYPGTSKQVEELVRFTGAGTCYKSQQGGNSGNGNDNGCQ